MFEHRRTPDELVSWYEGLPDGGSVTGFKGDSVQSLERWHVYLSDMNVVLDYCARIKVSDDDMEKEAYATQALLRFLKCFESTRGLRQQPLKPRKIFDFDDRYRLDVLRELRNRFVAHDEQILPGDTTLMATDANFRAMDVDVLSMRQVLHGFTDTDHLERLAQLAAGYCKDQFEASKEAFKVEFDKLDRATRERLVSGLNRHVISIDFEEYNRQVDVARSRQKEQRRSGGAGGGSRT